MNNRPLITAKYYSITIAATGITESTLKNYESYLRVHIVPTFKNRDIKTIQKYELENFQLKLKATHNAKGANLIITVIKTLFKEALREGYLVKDPAVFIKKFSEDNVREFYWTRSEIDQFLKANYLSELHDLFLVALNTGLRKGELAGLCWDRVDFARNVLSVTRTRGKNLLQERTKTNIKRVVPMNDYVRAVLLELNKKKSSSSVEEASKFLGHSPATNKKHYTLDENDLDINQAQINKALLLSSKADPAIAKMYSRQFASKDPLPSSNQLPPLQVQVELDSLPQMLSSITSVGFVVMKNESDDEEKKILSSS